MGGTLPRPPAVLDQPKLPTLLRLKVSPVVPPQCTGSLSRLGGGKGGRPDPALPLPGPDLHVLCAGGGRCPSRVHGWTIRTAAELHLSPFRLVQSRIEGLGLGEADMLPQTLYRLLETGVPTREEGCTAMGPLLAGAKAAAPAP